MPPRGVCRRVLEPRAVWEGPLGTSCCCQPDSGNPTVRDERGAHGDVDYGGIRNPLLGSKERRSKNSPPTVAHAVFLPDEAYLEDLT
jgi:hypothetical protein